MRIPAGSDMAGIGFTYIGPENQTAPAMQPAVQPQTSSIDFSDWFKGWGFENTTPNYQPGQTANPAAAPATAGQGTFMQQYGAYLAIGAGVLLLVVLMKRR